MLKIKRSNDQLIIITENGTAFMPLTDRQSINKSVDTLLEVIERVAHENNDLASLRTEDVESYDTKSVKALFKDSTHHFTAATRNSIENVLSFSPSYLQAESLRSQVKSIAHAYRDCAESVLASNGDTLSVGKTLYAKSTAIIRDLDLLESQLSAPLEKLKSIKMEKTMRIELLRKGIAQGKIIANAGFSGMTNDTLETAAALNKAKAVLGDSKARRAKIIRDAQKISK
jgi:hypothetical protein